jgi:hypothetical protein
MDDRSQVSFMDQSTSPSYKLLRPTSHSLILDELTTLLGHLLTMACNTIKMLCKRKVSVSCAGTRVGRTVTSYQPSLSKGNTKFLLIRTARWSYRRQQCHIRFIKVQCRKCGRMWTRLQSALLAYSRYHHCRSFRSAMSWDRWYRLQDPLVSSRSFTALTVTPFHVPRCHRSYIRNGNIRLLYRMTYHHFASWPTSTHRRLAAPKSLHPLVVRVEIRVSIFVCAKLL